MAPRSAVHQPIYTAEVLTAYLRACRQRGARESTLKRYRSLTRTLIDACPGGRFPTDGAGMAALTERLRRRYAPTTVNVALAVLSSAIRHAELAAPAPKRVKVNRPLPSMLDDAAQERLLGAVAELPQLRLAVLLALDAGLRVGEILKLQWRDIHMISRQVHVRDPKNYQDRKVPMTARLQGAAATVYRLQDQCWVGVNQSSWVFPSSKRLGEAKTGMSGEIDAAHSRAATGQTGWHVLRRTWATRLGAKGVPLPVIMRLAGWNSLEVAQRYVGSMQDMEAAAIAALEAGDVQEG